MGEKPFSAVATVPENDIWQTAIHRERKHTKMTRERPLNEISPEFSIR